MSTPVEVFAQPAGLAGGRFSLEKLSHVAAAARDEINVRAWVSHLLQQEGLTEMDVSTEANLARAQAILSWVQNKVAWIPDPKGREFIPKPYLLLPCKDGTCDRLPFLAGDDCDGKDALLLALLMAALNSVDVPVAAIGHGYNPDHPAIEHVLAAVGSDPQWSRHYYMDPSTHLPFGQCHPFKWERVIALPGQQVLCDAEVCLGTENMGKIAAGVGESGGNVDVMHVVGNVTQIDPVAWARSQRVKLDPVAWARSARSGLRRVPAPLQEVLDGLPGTVLVRAKSPNATGVTPSQVYADALAHDLDLAQQARARFQVVTSEADRILASLGDAALPDWSTEDAQAAGTALAATELLIGWLQQAINGARPVVVDPADPDGLWSLEGLPGDQVIVTGDDEAFALQQVATGQQSPNVTMGRGVGSLPVIIAGSLGFVAIHAGAAFLVYTVLEKSSDVLLRALEAHVISKYNECLKQNPAAECERFVKAIGEARAVAARANAVETKARNEPFLESLSFGKFVLGVATLGALGVAAKYVYEEVVKSGRSGKRKAA